MAKVNLWPLVRRFWGHIKWSLVYTDRPGKIPSVMPSYFQYRKWRYNIKPRWPRGNFYIADRFWGEQDIEWRQKWREAVKKPALTGYSLWMKEALCHLNKNEYAPEEPSESGGWAEPPLNPGERLKPCPPPPPKPPPKPPPPPPEPEPEPEPEPPPVVDCWICDAVGEPTPLYYHVAWEVWVEGVQYNCSWIMLLQDEENSCRWFAEHGVWGKMFRTELRILVSPARMSAWVSGVEAPFPPRPCCEYWRRWYGVGPLCGWAEEIPLYRDYWGGGCEYFIVEDFGFEWPY